MSTRQPAQQQEIDTPLYQQIRRNIREGIATGVHSAGERLPSESELAESFKTTRTTVRQALSQLVFEGLVVRQNGRGSFVSDRPVIRSAIDSRRCLTFEEQVALSGRVVTYDAFSLAQAQASPSVAARLRLRPGSDVFRMERLRLIDDRPICHEERFLTPRIGLHVTGQMLATLSAHRFAIDILKEAIPTIVVSITAETASPAMAARLGVPQGAALILRDNTHHTEDGTPVLCGRSTFRGDVSTDYVLGSPLPG